MPGRSAKTKQGAKRAGKRASLKSKQASIAKSANPARKTKSVRKAPVKRGTAALRDLLRVSEDRFRSVIETAAAPILLLSPELAVLDFNSEAERVYGRRREKLLGRDYFRALDPSGQG